MKGYTTSLQAALAGLLITIVVLSSAGPSHGALNHYVKKYNRLQATSVQLRNLTRYNYLIDYFSGFSFFKPRHRVHPDFIRALILSESNGNPRARSKKQALGLTQIVFETGRQAAAELYEKQIFFKHVERSRLKNLTPADLYDPAMNILLACYLIAKYNHTFNGRLDLVVAAWNAGENAVRSNNPPPYRETLNLIGKINGYFVYFLNRNNKRSRLGRG